MQFDRCVSTRRVFPRLLARSISYLPALLSAATFSAVRRTYASDSTVCTSAFLDAQKILVCAPRLQFCSIDISSAVNTYTPGIALSLPYLHTLALVDKSTCLGDIFQYAALPAVRDLTYHSKLCPAPDRRSTLLIILSHTDRRLERLTTNIQFYTLADLLACFEMTPRLTQMTNTHCPSGSTSAQRQYCCDLPVARKMSAVLRLLTPAPYPSRAWVLLPDLHVITLNLQRVAIYYIYAQN